MKNNFYVNLQDGDRWDEFPERGTNRYLDQIVKYFEFTIGDYDYTVRAEIDVDYDRHVFPTGKPFPYEEDSEINMVEFHVECMEGLMSNQGNSLHLNEKQLNELSKVIKEQIIFLS